ncbi:MAG: GxxExxY protein [Bacteroidota bacterium]|nr:GxxExxY protein [Bacteroidota bacterium]
MLHGEITQRIIRAFYDVYNTLGYGFLEGVYENALMLALEASGMRVDQQVKIEVFYEGVLVGTYRADLLVENCVIVELKASEGLRPEHAAQLTNYLRATRYEVGLLLNFGKHPEIQRRYFTNDRKRSGRA